MIGSFIIGSGFPNAMPVWVNTRSRPIRGKKTFADRNTKETLRCKEIISNETKEGAVERFMKALTIKNKMGGWNNPLPIGQRMGEIAGAD